MTGTPQEQLREQLPVQQKHQDPTRLRQVEAQ